MDGINSMTGFGLDPYLTPEQQRIAEANATQINAKLAEEGLKSQTLGKDDFLKLLVAQLENQDPMKPMEDREFIAQMAQFSSLEQISNMSREMTGMSSVLRQGQAYGMLGKTVTVQAGDLLRTGIVQAVSGQQNPEITVDGRKYGLDDIMSITN